MAHGPWSMCEICCGVWTARLEAQPKLGAPDPINSKRKQREGDEKVHIIIESIISRMWWRWLSQEEMTAFAEGVRGGSSKLEA